MEQKEIHECHKFWINIVDFYGEDNKDNMDIDITFATDELITCMEFYDYCKRAAYAYGFHPEIVEKTFV